jgi:hypothetical protein
MKKQRNISGRLKVLRTTVRSLGPAELRAAANGAYGWWPTLGCSNQCEPDCDYTR